METKKGKKKGTQKSKREKAGSGRGKEDECRKQGLQPFSREKCEGETAQRRR